MNLLNREKSGLMKTEAEKPLEPTFSIVLHAPGDV